MVVSPFRTLLVVAVVCVGRVSSSSPLHHLPAAAWQVPTAADVFFPAPIAPEAGDVLAIGSPAVVTWNASALPPDAAAIARIDLYHNTTATISEFVANLAEDVDPRAGAINYTVPDVQPGTYTIVIGGADGPCSGVFRIEPRYGPPGAVGPDGVAAWTVGGGLVVRDATQPPVRKGAMQRHHLHKALHLDKVVLSSSPMRSAENLTAQALADAPPSTDFLHGRQFGSVKFRVAAA